MWFIPLPSHTSLSVRRLRRISSRRVRRQRGQERIGKSANKWIFKSYWDDIRGVARQYGHPASFPLDLARRHILLYTKAGESVIDIFLGAGTMIAAAEMLGRVGFGMEIDPKYASVTLERLANLGLKPQRAKNMTARRPHERRETP
jgi:DNA modification methylase